MSSAGFALDHVWKLNDQIQLAGTDLLISHVQQTQLSSQSLKRRVRLIHDRVERIFHNSYVALMEHNLLANTGLLVIDTDTNPIGEPLRDFANANLLNIPRVPKPRI